MWEIESNIIRLFKQARVEWSKKQFAQKLRNFLRAVWQRILASSNLHLCSVAPIDHDSAILKT